jgi:urea transport system permease protein
MVRLSASRRSLQFIDDASVELLRQRAAEETDAAVNYQIETGLALAALDGSDRDARLAAIETLGGRLGADVRNRLAVLVEQAPDGSFVEPDADVRRAATEALAGIDTSRSLYAAVETMFFGLSLGSVLVLVAIGLAITFGVMGVINMARRAGDAQLHDASSGTMRRRSWSLAVAIPAAFLVAALAGMLLERTVIRFLYGRPLETLLATFGVSLLLQQFVRSVFSANNRAVSTPSWMSGTWQINEALSLTFNRLYIVAFTIIVFGLVMLVLRRTRLGLEIRAVSQNRAMARAVGIRSDRVDVLTFGLGSGIAGVAASRSASSPTSVPTSDSPTSSIRSWWWSSAASATSGAR